MSNAVVVSKSMFISCSIITCEFIMWTFFCIAYPAADPKTNVVLVDTSVVPNWALREALNDWHEQQGTKLLDPPAEQVFCMFSNFQMNVDWCWCLNMFLKYFLFICSSCYLWIAIISHMPFTGPTHEIGCASPRLSTTRIVCDNLSDFQN